MGKDYLQKLLTYINKVYHIGEKINSLKDKRPKPQVETSTISFLVLMGFMLQMRSFNRLNKWIKKGKFKRMFKRGTKLPSIDTIRYSLSEFDLDSLNDMHDNVIKTIKKNKVFNKGTIDGFRVAAIDGVELFESTEKHCDECLTRKDKNGKIHYFHKSIVCMMIGSKPNIIIGQEMLKPKKDSSEKDEGELTGSKRLIRKLHNKYKHFTDVIVADALYMNAPWINEILSLGMDTVIRVKDETSLLVQDAIGLFKNQQAHEKWESKNSKNKPIEVSVWDDYFQMTGMESKVRFIRFVEQSKHETKEMWLITTLNKGVSSKTIWKMMHKRWHIENSGFHHLKTEWHLDHCFFHDPTGTEAIVIFMFTAFNLLQLFFFRCLRNFQEKGLLQIDIIEDLWDEMLIYKSKNGYFLDTT